MDNKKSWVGAIEDEYHPTVMVIDDERAKLCEYAEELFLRGFDVVAVQAKPGMGRREMPRHGIALHEVSTVSEILDLVRDIRPDAVLCDWDLNWDRIKGDRLLEEIGLEEPGTALALHSSKYQKQETENGLACFPKRFGLYDVAAHFHAQLDHKGPSRA